MVAAFVVLALLIAGFVAFSSWARSGYFVDFDDADRVTVYKGKPDGVLWFDPTTENTVALTRDGITEESASLVEDQPEFSDLGDAVTFVRELEQLDDADPDDDATGPLGTVPPAEETDEPADTAPDDDAEPADTAPPSAPDATVPDTAGSP